MDELVVLEGLHHEQSEVHTAGEVALEDGVAHVPAPYRQALALAFLEVAPAHDRPAGVAGEHPPAGLHLVVEIGEPRKARERPEDVHEGFDLPRVHVPAVAADVPPAREDEARTRRRVVEYRLGRAGRVPVDAARDEDHEHSVAARDRFLDDLGVVRRSRNDSDAPLELVELPHALLPAHADHLVAAIKRVLHHVLPELPRGSDDADSHRACSVAPCTLEGCQSSTGPFGLGDERSRECSTRLPVEFEPF